MEVAGNSIQCHHKKMFRVHSLCFSEVRQWWSHWVVVYDVPTTLSLETNVTVIVKDLFVDCVRIIGNTVFDSFSISPELSQDLAFDMKRNCLGGTYKGNSFGKQDYLVQGTNPFGTVKNVIHLYFTRNFDGIDWSVASLQKGLRSKYYEVKDKYK